MSTSSSVPDTSNLYFNNILQDQKSFIIFGRENIPFNLQIGSRTSEGLYFEMDSVSSQVGLSRDRNSRSVTIVGDINNDGFDDVVLGFPYFSTCFVYLGNNLGSFENLLVSFAIYGLGGDAFGWSVSRAGDINVDGCQDMVICAKDNGICNVLFGNRNFPDFGDIYVESMTTAQGFHIVGNTDSTVNFGMSIDYLGDFNNDGWDDLGISAMTFNSQGIVYILFGRPVDQLDQDIILAKYLNNSPSSVLSIIITSTAFSFVGFSITGAGDLNRDGFADIAIGSIPYKGGYTTQETYVIYGRRLISDKYNTLDMSQMVVGVDGFTIKGAGFLVCGVGDLNQDGHDDLLVSSNYRWQNQFNGYLISFPKNMSSPPTFLPSSFPSNAPSTQPSALPTISTTTFTPSNCPSVSTMPPVGDPLNNNSAAPTYLLTTKPTRATMAPSRKRTLLPSAVPVTQSLPPTTIRPTLVPTQTPSIFPTINPSRKPTRATTSRRPSFLPTMSPTSNQTFSMSDATFVVTNYDSPGNYEGSPGINQVFVLSGEGTYYITARVDSPSPAPGKNSENSMKVITMVPAQNQVIVEGFSVNSDFIDLSKYSSLKSMKDLSFSTNPLTIRLPSSSTIPTAQASPSTILSTHVQSQSQSQSSPRAADSNSQTVTLLSYSNLNELKEENFLFQSSAIQSASSEIISAESAHSLIIFAGVIILFAIVVFFQSLRNEIKQIEEKRKEKVRAAREEDESDWRDEEFIHRRQPNSPEELEEDEENQKQEEEEGKDDSNPVSSLCSSNDEESLSFVMSENSSSLIDQQQEEAALSLSRTINHTALRSSINFDNNSSVLPWSRENEEEEITYDSHSIGEETFPITSIQTADLIDLLLAHFDHLLLPEEQLSPGEEEDLDRHIFDEEGSEERDQ